MKKLFSYLGFFLLANIACAALIITSIPQTDLASDMTSDTLFYNSVVTADKSAMSSFSFGGHDFTELATGPSPDPVVGPLTITVDYLGRDASDANNLLMNLGLGDTLLFQHYGVIDDEDDSVKIEVADGYSDVLSFWNQDVTKGIDGIWDDSDHFKVFLSTTPGGANFLFLSIDDRGSSQPNLQDWNDGSFLVTSYTDISQIAIPEPASIGWITMISIMGLLFVRRRIGR